MKARWRKRYVGTAEGTTSPLGFKGRYKRTATIVAAGAIPPLSSVGASGTLTNHAGGTLSGVTLSDKRFTGGVSFGAGAVTLNNCRFDAGITTYYADHGVVTLNYCTNPGQFGWWFEENAAGVGGQTNVWLNYCLMDGGLYQAMRPKGTGAIQVTDTWFVSAGEPTPEVHTEVIQHLFGADGVYTRCAFSREPVSNGTVTAVLTFGDIGDGGGSTFTDCEVGYWNGSAWVRGGGVYQIYPGQSKWYRPRIHSTAGTAWYAGNAPAVLVDPVYIP